MKFIVITLLIALFVSFLFGCSEGQGGYDEDEQAMNEAHLRRFKECRYSLSGVNPTCGETKHCQIINGQCWSDLRKFDPMVARCDLPDEVICNAYSSNCHFFGGKCRKKK